MLEPLPKLDSRLPGIAISEAMRQQLYDLAEANNLSVSEIVRRSVDLFLSENAKSISAEVNQSSEERAS